MRHPEWVTTIAFYKALQIVEAVFSRDKDIIHRQSHETRLETLKQTRAYEKLYRHYRPLHAASVVARYLTAYRSGKAYEKFSDFMSAEQVKNEMLGHLDQIEKAAMRSLSAKGRAAMAAN